MCLSILHIGTYKFKFGIRYTGLFCAYNKKAGKLIKVRLTPFDKVNKVLLIMFIFNWTLLPAMGKKHWTHVIFTQLKLPKLVLI